MSPKSRCKHLYTINLKGYNYNPRKLKAQFAQFKSKYNINLFKYILYYYSVYYSAIPSPFPQSRMSFWHVSSASPNKAVEIRAS